MRVEVILAGTATVLLVLTVVAPLTIPGAIAETDPTPVRAGEVDIGEVTVRAAAVGGERATLAVQTYLEKWGGPVENVTVRLRAIDEESGLVVATRTVPVGDLEGTREVQVNGSLILERSGGYRIETLLYIDESRVASAGKEVAGFGALQPHFARSSVHFRSFDSGLPTIEYSIERARQNRTTLAVTTYLINQGASASDDYRLVLKARQVDSNIVADQTAVSVDSLASGVTATPTGSLTVPTGYNYYLDAVLWRDGVVVGTARSVANLHPTETVHVNETRRSLGLRVEDFDPEAPDVREERTETVGLNPSGGAVPGFGPLLSLLSLLIAAGALWRMTHE